MLDSKGYTISDLAPLAIVFVVLAITVSMGSLVLSEVNNSVDTNEDTVYQTINDGINALADFSGWFGVLVVVVIAAIIIGIVMRYFGGMAQTSGRKV